MIKNLTPHLVVYRDARSGKEYTFTRTGCVPRVNTIENETGDVEEMCMITQTTGSVIDLPAEMVVCKQCGGRQEVWLEGPNKGASCKDCLWSEVEKIWLIVSRMVFDAAPSRMDLLCPDIGKGAVRDKDGRIIAVTRFVHH